MNKQTRIRHQCKIRAQRLRDKRKACGITIFQLSMNQAEKDKLNEISRDYI